MEEGGSREPEMSESEELEVPPQVSGEDAKVMEVWEVLRKAVKNRRR